MRWNRVLVILPLSLAAAASLAQPPVAPAGADAALAVDIVLGAGGALINPNEVKAYTATGGATPLDFNAYGAGQWGTNVCLCNIDGGEDDEILTGPGPGPIHGPQVRGFKSTGAAMGKVNFYAYGTLKYGVKVGCGNLDSDSYEEILTSPGPGSVFGPHVRGWNYDNTVITPITGISYFAYGTLRYGANVASADVDWDMFDEILTGAGPSSVFGPQIRGFNVDGGPVTPMGKINFVAFGAPQQYGAEVSGGDVDGDNYGEIGAGRGPGPNQASELRGFDYDGNAVALAPGFDITPWATMGGSKLSLGDLDLDGHAELVASQGADPAGASQVKAFGYDGAALSDRGFTITPPWSYGSSVATGALGY